MIKHRAALSAPVPAATASAPAILVAPPVGAPAAVAPPLSRLLPLRFLPSPPVRPPLMVIGPPPAPAATAPIRVSVLSLAAPAAPAARGLPPAAVPLRRAGALACGRCACRLLPCRAAAPPQLLCRGCRGAPVRLRATASAAPVQRLPARASRLATTPPRAPAPAAPAALALAAAARA
jgi:hypothetical protein